jgi:hypothetical protein
MRKTDLQHQKPVKARASEYDSFRNEMHEAVSHLLNKMLDEDSTAMDTIRSSPYSDQLVKHMHSGLAISHDLKWEKQPKIAWSDVKKMSPNFVLLSGSRGTAAVKWDGSREMWRVLTATGEGIKKYNESSINTAMPYIKDDIGKVMGVWEAVGAGKSTGYSNSSKNGPGAVDNLRLKRELSRKITNPNMMDPAAGYDDNLKVVRNKLRPLYMRYIEHAIADIKGVVGMQLKAGAYDKASEKIVKLGRLQDIYDRLESNPRDIPEKIEGLIKHSAMMSAAHFYPEQTGQFTKSYGGSIDVADKSGLRQFVKDIANGDNKKLATLMAYFKNALLNARI